MAYTRDKLPFYRYRTNVPLCVQAQESLALMLKEERKKVRIMNASITFLARMPAEVRKLVYARQAEEERLADGMPNPPAWDQIAASVVAAADAQARLQAQPETRRASKR